MKTQVMTQRDRPGRSIARRLSDCRGAATRLAITNTGARAAGTCMSALPRR